MPNPTDAPGSDTIEQPVAAAPAVEGQDAPADSSPAAQTEGEKPGAAPEGGEKQDKGEKLAAPKTPLEVTKGALDPNGKEAAPATEKPKEEKKPAAAKDGESEAEEPPKDGAAWRDLKKENRILKVAQEKNSEAIKSLEPKAQGYDELMGFMTANGIDREGFSSALTIVSAIRNDPFKAYDMLRPVMEQLESIVGERLPADLQAKVDANEMTPQVASELAKERARREVTESQHQRTQQRFQETQQQLEDRNRREDVEKFASSVENAVRGWEKQWMATDPDAAKKLPFVMDAIGVKLQATPPQSPEEAVELAKTCLKEVNDRLKGVMPAPTAKTPHVLPNGSNLPTKVVPGSPLDVVKNALRPGAAAR